MVRTFLRIPKGLQFAILGVVQSLGGGAHGVAITEALNRNSDEKIGTPQVYLALGRLEQKGYLTSVHKKIGGQGRARRVYTLPKEGLVVLEAGRKFYGVR